MNSFAYWKVVLVGLVVLLWALVLFPPRPARAVKPTPAWATCYDFPAPAGAVALWCDVTDPATGKLYSVVQVAPGGITMMKGR